MISKKTFRRLGPWDYSPRFTLSVAQVSFRVRCEAPQVRSLRKFRVDLYRRTPLSCIYTKTAARRAPTYQYTTAAVQQQSCLCDSHGDPVSVANVVTAVVCAVFTRIPSHGNIFPRKRSNRAVLRMLLYMAHRFGPGKSSLPPCHSSEPRRLPRVKPGAHRGRRSPTRQCWCSDCGALSVKFSSVAKTSTA